jgi:hypothetical protein
VSQRPPAATITAEPIAQRIHATTITTISIIAASAGASTTASAGAAAADSRAAADADGAADTEPLLDCESMLRAAPTAEGAALLGAASEATGSTRLLSFFILTTAGAPMGAAGGAAGAASLRDSTWCEPLCTLAGSATGAASGGAATARAAAIEPDSTTVPTGSATTRHTRRCARRLPGEMEAPS